jgi:hypothetical protein
MPLLFNPFASPTRFGHTSGLYHAFPPGLCIRDTRRLSDRHGRVILTGSFCLTLLDSPLYGIGSTRQVGLCPSWLDIYAVTRMHIAILPYSIPSSKLNPTHPSSAFLVSVSSVSTHPCRHLQGFRGRGARTVSVFLGSFVSLLFTWCNQIHRDFHRTLDCLHLHYRRCLGFSILIL